MLPGYRYYSIIALVILIIFFSVNVWLFYHWRFDHEMSWRWSLDIKRIEYICREHTALVVGLFVYTILQLFPLLVAPIGLGDPILLALAGPHILSPLWSIASRLGVPFLFVRLTIIGLIIILIWYATRKSSILFFKSLWLQIKKSQILFIIIPLVFLLLLFYAWILSSLFYSGTTFRNIGGATGSFSFPSLLLTNLEIEPPVTFHREPPFGRLILIIFTLIFGGNEIAVRLPQLLFLLGAMLYLYRLVSLYNNKEIALFSTFIFGFIPPVFYYSHLAFLAGGLLFFIVAPSFYFLRHLRDNSRNDLLMAIFILAVGSLYNRPAILVFAIFTVYIALQWIYRRKTLTVQVPIRDYIISGWFFIASIIPWLVIVGFFAGPGRFVRFRYDFMFSNLLSFDLATGYLRQLPFQVSWPIVILILLALLYRLFFQRDKFFTYTFIWFLMYYIFYTLDPWGKEVIGHDRFALAWFPVMSIWIGEFILGLSWIRGNSFFRIIVPSSLILYLGLSCTIIRNPDLNIHYASYLDALSIYSHPSSEYTIADESRRDYGHNRLPYGKVFKYLKKNGDLNGKILVNKSRQLMQFYSYKYELKPDIYNCIDCAFETKKELYDFCIENKIKYILIESGYYQTRLLSNEWLSTTLLGAFNKSNFKPFRLIERFDYGVNALLLLQISNI